MKTTDNMQMMGMEEFVVPESLFEALDQVDYDNNSSNCSNISSADCSIMEYDLGICSETMASFLEMEQVPEVEAVAPAPVIRPSVIMKPVKKAAPTPSLADILTSCGIEYDLVETEPEPASSPSPVSSPSSIHSDMELEKTQDLIDELEDFFMKTEGKPTLVDNTIPADYQEPVDTMNIFNNNTLSLEDLKDAVTTSMITEDGENVVIIIAPSSPAECQVVPSPLVLDPLPSPGSSLGDTADTDPEWSPSPASISSPPAQTKPRKKYARSKPPKAPTGPYPTDKKERKKAQNRTAAFRYREKMKSQQDVVDEELEALEERNAVLKDQFAEMETEFKYLKKLMTEAGLGKYAAAVKY